MKTAVGRIAFILLAFVTCVTTISADDASSKITVSHAWARATVPSAKNGAVFLTITAPPSLSDRLIAVRSSAAEQAQLHRHIMENGIARMASITAIELAQGKAVKLDPQGLHVMLVGLKRPLQEGDRIALILVFEKSGDMSVEVPVLAANAAEPLSPNETSADSPTRSHDMHGYQMEGDHLR